MRIAGMSSCLGTVVRITGVSSCLLFGLGWNLPGKSCADNQSVQLLGELVRISGNVQLLEVWIPNPSAKDSYVRRPAQ